MQTLLTYINDSISELHQVRWPTQHQALRLTGIVIGFLAVSSIFFGVIDLGIGKVITTTLQFF